MSISTIIRSCSKEILKTWTEDVLMRQEKQISLIKLSEHQIRKQTNDLFIAFVDGIEKENFEDLTKPEYFKLLELIESISKSRAEIGFSPTETVLYILSLKDAFPEYLKSYYSNEPNSFIEVISKINKLIDKLGLMTFEFFVKKREEIIKQQSHSLLELSTPIIKVWNQIVLMPLVGIIDTVRAQQMIERLLQGIVANEAKVAVIDISGVAVIDTRVAQHLIKTIIAASMLGSEVILTGISPEIAQTIVKLDIDLGKVKTRGTLKSGIEEAFSLINLKIISSNLEKIR